MKNLIGCLALIGTMGDAVAGGCISCAVKVRRQVIVKDRIVAVQVPIVVIPSYGATYIPPAPLIIQPASTVVGQQQYSVQQSAGYNAVVQQPAVALQQGYQYQQAQSYQAPMPRQAMPCPQTNGLAQEAPDLATVLMRIDQRLATLEAKCEIKAVPQLRRAPPPKMEEAPDETPPDDQGGQVRRNPMHGLRVLSNRCATCHDAAVSKVKGKDFAMFQNGAFFATGKQRQAMRDKIVAGHMPPQGAQPLTEAEKAASVAFLESLN